jgi:extracellular elastinolytic metalloproteinase
MKRFFTLFTLLLLLGSAALSAQDAQIAIDFLQEKYSDLGLTSEDVRDLNVTDDYTSKGIRHIYVNQQYQGVPVFNAQAILHYRGTSLLSNNNGFVADLASQNLSTAPAFSAQSAVSSAINVVSSTFGTPVEFATEEGVHFFILAAVSPEPIQAKLVFLPTEAKGVRLAWNITIDQHAAKSDIWTMLVDAQDGDLLGQHNHVVKCSFGNKPHQHFTGQTGAKQASPSVIAPVETAIVDGSSYNVYPFGIESPVHGDRAIVSEPADDIASPYGWHDTNGEDGAEFTTTRGNNAFAYLDKDGTANSPDPGFEAEGGVDLIFDFPYANGSEPDSIIEAALAQVFYTTSSVHDWLYHAGFDEPSGNFQTNNYKGEGEERDPVLAEAQDGSGTNNANFSTPPDGSSPRMQMFVWENGSTSVMNATFPSSAAGPYTTGVAGFGELIAGAPTTAEVIFSEPAQGCTAFTNDLTGKIALITRGVCEFGTKVLNAENAGAIGAIICNDTPEGSPDGRGGTIGMAPGAEGGSVTIPSVFVSQENCVPLRNALEAGDSLSVTFLSTAPPPIDGDFDSGIVAHEIGHGVSNRLVGGPNNTSCLFTNEQMGEGWSDFYTLSSTPLTNVPNPDGTEGRGIGNFAIGRDAVTGPGIRRKLYSTDMTVNDHTYDDIIINGAAPHDLGEIWATTLWDLYWAMSEEYGFDEDLIRGTGGNNLAVELVTEGLKFTRCGPGLLDGRDGILEADLFNNQGANQCLIWEVFARRGMGFSAQGGSRDDRLDGRESYDLSPYCIGGVQATKAVNSATVDAGDDVSFTIRVTNYDSVTATGVIVTDEIPEGLVIDEATVAGAEFTISGNTIVFTIGELEFDDAETIRYTAKTSPTDGSAISFFDGAEDGDDDWEVVAIDPAGLFFWEQTDTTPYEGELTWYVVDPGSTQDQALQIFEPLPVTGDKPGLRFFTKYETEARWDAGIIETSLDNTNWTKVSDDMITRGGYRGDVAETASAQLLGTGSFWGNSGGFVETIVDLSSFAGEDLYFRFRFVADANTPGRGWWIDNIEMIDIFNYDGVATVSSNEFPDFEAGVGNLGVLALGGEDTDSTDDLILGQTDVSIFPNPADDFVNVKISSERAGEATIQLISVDGRMVYNQSLNLLPGGVTTNINTAELPAGIYMIQVVGANQISTTKLTVN